MAFPFPGMDPYLEHPVLWESVHARLIVAIANQLQPRLDPRYVASIASLEAQGDTAVILEVEELEVHETRVEILDSYNQMKLVALIEVISPTNKTAGPGRESYIAKQQEILARDCHLVEIDLLRHGRHVLCIQDWRVAQLRPYDYLCCVNRWPRRNRYELYARRLRDRLPRLKIPLAEPDPDVDLDLQAAVEQVYGDGRYLRRVRYDEPCEPALSSDDQQWAMERWQNFRRERADLFPATSI